MAQGGPRDVEQLLSLSYEHPFNKFGHPWLNDIGTCLHILIRMYVLLYLLMRSLRKGNFLSSCFLS